MALSLEALIVRLSNQLVSTLEEGEILRTRLRLVSAQASAAQTDKAALARRLFSSARDSVWNESELRSLVDDNKRLVDDNRRLVDKVRAAAILATALRISVHPKGRLATLFDKLFEQLEDTAVAGNSQEVLESEMTVKSVEREPRARRRQSSPSPPSTPAEMGPQMSRTQSR